MKGIFKTNTFYKNMSVVSKKRPVFLQSMAIYPFPTVNKEPTSFHLLLAINVD
jgi:hypothetical protein